MDNYCLLLLTHNYRPGSLSVGEETCVFPYKERKHVPSVCTQQIKKTNDKLKTDSELGEL